MSSERDGGPFLDPVRCVDDLTRLHADPWCKRRWLTALFGGTVISVVLFSTIPWHAMHRGPQPQLGPKTVIALETPPPTPRPTARPTPRPAPTPQPTVPPTPPPLVVRRYAPVPHRAAPKHAQPMGAARAAPVEPPRPTKVAQPSQPAGPGGPAVAIAPGTQDGFGVGSGVGAASGAGNGTGGDGTDADTASPCGYVEFIPDEAPRKAGSTWYEHVRATVHYPDGHTEDADFPYSWVYANAPDTDPWSPANLPNKDEVVRAQLPPPGADTSGYSDVIRYVLDHTTPAGVTVLHECPRRRGVNTTG